MMVELTLSPLPKTWIFDLDGTLVEHNGYKTGNDKLLPGVREFFAEIPIDDFVLILTGRERSAEPQTVKFLSDNNIRYNKILFEMPLGERLLFNDKKNSGLKMSYAVNIVRNEGLEGVKVCINGML